MSRAFTKESESEWLGDVAPDVASLERYLTRENGGIKVALLRTSTDPQSGKPIYEMSNGTCYALDEDERWYVVV